MTYPWLRIVLFLAVACVIALVVQWLLGAPLGSEGASIAMMYVGPVMGCAAVLTALWTGQED